VRIKFFNSKSGATLIEVMIGLIIIAMVIIGGGMFFFYGRVIIIREAHRRAALLVASQRLEELKAADYSEITSESFDPGYTYYIVWDQENNKWQPSEDPSYDYVMVDNLVDQKMATQAWCIDDDGDGSYDYLQVRAKVEWTNGRTMGVSVTTLIAPR